MAKVRFLGSSRADVEIAAKDLSELAQILRADKTLTEYLKTCAVSINGNIVKDLSTKLAPQDEVCLLPPVCGG
ncbi:MAG: MoaD/ThiS family protein [Helicobacteraceae bacterium]